jgi:hypothetical protein
MGVTSGVNLSQSHRFEFPYDVGSAGSSDPIEDRRRARANQGQALRVAAKAAASLDRPCARRREILRSGRKNARGADRTKEWTANSNRWLYGKIRLALT